MASNNFSFMNFNYELEGGTFEIKRPFNESINFNEMQLMVTDQQVEAEDELNLNNETVVELNLNNETVVEQNLKNDAVVEQNLNNEAVVEQNLQTFSTMRYDRAHALIRDQIKEVIFKQQLEEVTSVVLNARKKIVSDEIKHLEKQREEVVQETEEINVKLEIDKDEMENLQQRMLYNGEIINKLQDYINSMEEDFKKIKRRSEYISEEAAKQKKMFSERTEYWQSKISELKSRIAMKKAAMGKTDQPNPLKEENWLLRAKVLEKRKHLEMLEKRRQDILLKKQRVSPLQKEKERLEKIVDDQNRNLSELRNTKEKYESEIAERSKELNSIVDKKRSRKDSLIETHSEQKITIQAKTDEYDKLVYILKSEEECKVQVTEKNDQVHKQLNDRRQELAETSKKQAEDDQASVEKLLQIDNKLSDVIRENEELTNNLEVLKQQYVAKTEEMAEKLTLKVEMEKKLREDEIVLSKIQLVEEKIGRKQKAIDELSEKIANLSSDKRLQDLEKSKAYLTSSTDYMRNKYESLLKDVESVKAEVDDVKKTEEFYCNSLLEKLKRHDNLLKTLKDLNDAEDEDKPERPLSSILKSPSVSKKSPVSPKKVQFEGLSSYESSGSSQPTIEGKSLFEILNEIEAGTFKKPTAVKKRKVDLE